MKRDPSVGFYRISYENGVTQTKELITQNDHVWHQTLTRRKAELEEMIKEHKRKNKKKNKPIDPAITAELNEVKDTIKREFPYLFFVVGSPMHEALATGIIRIGQPAGNAGIYKMKAEQIAEGEM